MALIRFLLVILCVTMPLLFFSRAAVGEAGVSYGRVATDLPQDQASVVNLLNQNGITMVRIYDASPQVLTSLANTGIKVMVMMPNEKLEAAADDPNFAAQWVQSNVKAYYPATQIHGVAVGNEVFDSAQGLTQKLVPAMTHVQTALANLGLADAVKVSTPVAFDALTNTYPPSAGRFTDNLVPVMKSMLDLLQRTGSYLTLNVYPFFAYYNSLSTADKISLDYALGNTNAGVRDDVTGNNYQSLLDAMVDSAYYAMDDLGFPSMRLVITESGWPSKGHPKGGKPPRSGRRLLDGDQDSAASIANAQAYNNNLINRVLSGRTGTPHRPNADMDVYIFALFNENSKGSSDDTEANFGLFYPNEQKVYAFSFQGSGGPPGAGTPTPPSWCVANNAVGDARLQAALDYACGHGADCSALQPGGSCFEPNTKLAHASYAFNSYYQRNGRAAGACDFDGAASIVYQEPANTCSSEKPSWCAANAAVGDARLQAALDYACGNGADCSAIQPGGSCFQPNTVFAHASYAVNDYYQRKNRASGTCDFSGAASVVYQQPSGTCTATAAAASWCVAKAGVGDAQLQAALDYACGNGADCSAIQAGGACFQPDTKAAHASYAFNSYYQNKGQASGTCDFSGAASIVYQQPKIGNCVLPSNG
ncbi:Glucan endo-1,3-beta-glucosidase 13 [Dichanthelium oligosanthes]|uniref:glucan endo-1,3-beta-D-glucosidase n=1 Tax=Dichanthelium oligosanthes TaxID=888268 RepID=A0A1E5UXD4_9POAL|nr:Glucan endo-1,3-beta-glucosidase 13 [Dichanthelium oligosanthes]